ncbi:hypothetical protein TSAR_010141 [Trichomalopsis sarcophagae]|uniref:Uncharacterized protein n=1 Tax=Trichomalopsis sarcophagae TaxID=543379 RepID=A0A232EZZ3_9HYME|nr:hypothetical protein TSAR_010141 [Trichomalopsis sarcophagae]
MGIPTMGNRTCSADEFRNSDTLTQLDNNPGMISELISPLASSTTDWKIIQKVELDSYFGTGAILTEQWEKLFHYCDELFSPCIHKSLLDATHKQPDDSINQVNRIIQLLSGLGGSKDVRDKRSVLPFIGQISKILFGTLDENTEASLRDLIQITSNDTKEVARLLAEQTELVEAKLTEMDKKIEVLDVARGFFFKIGIREFTTPESALTAALGV